ncbi:hypothetical protein VOLCADRAFT_102830 [Volvox carteri f. nagariensis]|uniref:Protein kinase domain-containing protein n=1 Tax=Volvox carteri f. nagariensis TaxID=3068 RepID=D8TID7_VOLCA|nr:uncharacterized protein VOLCADRAFT_102830 [Volvox carteri f. nagariensis]EFJ53222.1 hypothetical protein VOLCADRAFT_102830 [Volvox carteri f. nagariensis]|eukprot:XP_002946227.1 hypothetical protein VOLCADRAFT_102830 [Volvox carteri f. nagariensis]
MQRIVKGQSDGVWLEKKDKHPLKWHLYFGAMFPWVQCFKADAVNAAQLREGELALQKLKMPNLEQLFMPGNSEAEQARLQQFRFLYWQLVGGCPMVCVCLGSASPSKQQSPMQSGFLSNRPGPASKLNFTGTAYENGSGGSGASSATPRNHLPKSEVAAKPEEVQPGEQQVVGTEPTVVTPLEQAAVVITPDTRPQPNLELHVRLMDPAAEAEAGDSSNSPTAGAVTGVVPLHSKEEEVSGSGSGSAGGGPPCSGSNVVELSPVVCGKGTFGRVVEGTYRGQRVAVKLLASDGPWGCPVEALASSFAQEVQSTLVGSQVLHIAISIANALAYLHPTISHRDLKPANVLLNDPHSDLPTVKLTDFGLSRLRVTVAPTEHPDVGTPAYMAPECFDLQNRQVTHKADIFALGVLLWEMLACRRPWPGLNPLEIGLMVAFNGMRLPLNDLVVSKRCPHKLGRLVLACWEMDPDRRPAAAETVKELALILQGQQLQFKQQLVQSVLDRTGQEGGGGPCLQLPTAPRAEFTAAAAADARDGDVALVPLENGSRQSIIRVWLPDISEEDLRGDPSSSNSLSQTGGAARAAATTVA